MVLAVLSALFLRRNRATRSATATWMDSRQIKEWRGWTVAVFLLVDYCRLNGYDNRVQMLTAVHAWLTAYQTARWHVRRSDGGSSELGVPFTIRVLWRINWVVRPLRVQVPCYRAVHDRCFFVGDLCVVGDRLVAPDVVHVVPAQHLDVFDCSWRDDDLCDTCRWGSLRAAADMGRTLGGNGSSVAVCVEQQSCMAVVLATLQVHRRWTQSVASCYTCGVPRAVVGRRGGCRTASYSASVGCARGTRCSGPAACCGRRVCGLLWRRVVMAALL